MNGKPTDLTTLAANLRAKSSVAASFDKSERVVELGAAQQAVVEAASISAQAGEVQDARAQFEAWARWFAASVARNDEGDYASTTTNILWCAWKAALAARQPRAQVPVSVSVPGAPTSCKHCDSTELQWFAHVRILNDVQQGRLNTHDVGCVFVLGCEECSETLRVVKADDIAALLNAAPPAQGIDLGQMKRYALDDGFDRHRGVETDKGAHLYEHDDGDWVKWDDVEALIDQRDAAPGVGNG